MAQMRQVDNPRGGTQAAHIGTVTWHRTERHRRSPHHPPRTLTVGRVPASPARAATAVLTRPRRPAVPLVLLLVRVGPPGAPTHTTSARPLPRMRCSTTNTVLRARRPANRRWRRRHCPVHPRPVPPRATSRAAAAVLPVAVVVVRSHGGGGGGCPSAMSCGAGQRQGPLRAAGAADARAQAGPRSRPSPQAQCGGAQAALRVLPPRVVELVSLVLRRGEGETAVESSIGVCANGSGKLS